MKKLVPLAIAILFCVNGFAQNSIEGGVADSMGVPIPYGIVALLSALDSGAVKGTPTNEEGTCSQ